MISSVEDFLRVDDLLQEQCAELKQLEEELKGAQQLALQGPFLAMDRENWR